jgi:probable rRNA maturation factor
MIHVSRNSIVPGELSVSRIRRIAAEAFKTLSMIGDASIIFTDNQAIQEMNREYRKIDAVTDVLSFASNEIDPMTGAHYLGDVIIASEKAQSQAQQAGRPLIDELTMLIVHGCLHLCSLDHTTDAEMKIMKNHQESILTLLEVDNPSWPEDN